LKIHNLLSIYRVESEIIDLISEINDISITEAKTIYNTLVLNFENLSVHSMEKSAAPSFIKLSDHQILRSLCGCLDRPFEFMLDELRQQYPKEWDINTNLREQEFRNELYSFFEPERFYRINRSVEIKENGKIITDIDACIADKVSGDIALIQLKWQDFTKNSNKSLYSKRKNYIEKTNAWIQTIRQWIENVSEKKIADCLGLNPKYIKKENIKLFVLGRFNGNYSGSKVPNQNVAWGQWYQIILIMRGLDSDKKNLTTLYEVLSEQNPYKIKPITRPLIYKYGQYTLKIG